MCRETTRRMTSGRIAGALLAGASVMAAAQPVNAQGAVTFSTADEGLISADLYGSGACGVVLVPGGRFDNSSWEPEARVLADAGFLVLAISLRGRGESRAGTAGEDALYLDVLGAVRYLRTLGVSSISAVGASLGGWALAEAVIRTKPGEIDRAVFLAHSVIEDPEKLHGRKLFIVSREDIRGGGVRRLAEIRDQYERAPEPKELLILEGGAHAQALFQTGQGEQLMNHIVCFLSTSSANQCRHRSDVTSNTALQRTLQAVTPLAFARAAPACRAAELGR